MSRDVERDGGNSSHGGGEGDATEPLDFVLIEGTRYRPIPYGEERIHGVDLFSVPCHLCDAAPGAHHRPSCAIGAGLRHHRPLKCRDCGVAIGRNHVLPCGIEQCPRCGGQYVSCACDSSEDAEGDEES